MERSTHTLAVKSQTWLVDALLSLLQRRPYGEISVSDLCREAGLDRRTFYRNFKDKQDVLHHYFSGLQEKYLLAMKSKEEHSFTPLAKVYFSFWMEHLHFFKTAQRDPALGAILLEMLNTVIPTIYADTQGNLPRDLGYRISFLIGGFHNTLVQWLTLGARETAEEMSALLAEMFQDTISYFPD